MGKQQIKNEDVLKRINFMYQAAYASLKASEDVALCRYYISSMQIIARRSTILLHPDMKRTICKRCCSLLVPGKTAMVRVKSKRQKYTLVTCLECGTMKRYVNNPKYIQPLEIAENWEDIMVDGQLMADRKKKQGKQQQQKQQQQKQNQQKQNQHQKEQQQQNQQQEKERSQQQQKQQQNQQQQQKKQQQQNLREQKKNQQLHEKGQNQKQQNDRQQRNLTITATEEITAKTKSTITEPASTATKR